MLTFMLFREILFISYFTGVSRLSNCICAYTLHTYLMFVRIWTHTNAIIGPYMGHWSTSQTHLL